MEILGLWFICAIVTAIVASSKGRSGFGWFLLGMLISIFALILVALLPSLKSQREQPGFDTHLSCPDCKELVLNEARKCKHCGASLVPLSEQPARKTAPKVSILADPSRMVRHILPRKK